MSLHLPHPHRKYDHGHLERIAFVFAQSIVQHPNPNTVRKIATFGRLSIAGARPEQNQYAQFYAALAETTRLNAEYQVVIADLEGDDERLERFEVLIAREVYRLAGDA